MNALTTEEEAYRYCEDTRILKNRLELGWLELAKRFIVIEENNLAQGQYGGFSLFLDEIRIKKGTVDRMTRVYKRLCVDYGVPEAMVIEAGGYQRLYEILPLCKSKESAIAAIEHTRSLPSRESVKEEVKTLIAQETGAPVAECEHPKGTYVHFIVCADCGGKKRVFQDPNDPTKFNLSN